ncbi:MAG: YajQ family cyclic di-GMP-binding protein [Pseudomonadota bacterium]
MPSFDVVSEIDGHELQNAVDQANREISNRFDFKGSDAKIELAESVMTLVADSDFQIQQMQPMIFQKLSKRGIDVKALDQGDIQTSGQKARQVITVRQGIDKETASKIVKAIKASKAKVQAAIQGEQVRITGKKRDDLQGVIAMLKEGDYGLPMQYINFRD